MSPVSWNVKAICLILGEPSEVDHHIAHHATSLDRFMRLDNVTQGESGSNAVL